MTLTIEQLEQAMAALRYADEEFRKIMQDGEK